MFFSSLSFFFCWRDSSGKNVRPFLRLSVPPSLDPYPSPSCLPSLSSQERQRSFFQLPPFLLSAGQGRGKVPPLPPFSHKEFKESFLLPFLIPPNWQRERKILPPSPFSFFLRGMAGDIIPFSSEWAISLLLFSSAKEISLPPLPSDLTPLTPPTRRNKLPPPPFLQLERDKSPPIFY